MDRRFLTPIKEPEELGYLFLCIAIGLGLGAAQYQATTLFAILILLILGRFREYRKKNHDDHKGVFLTIDWENQDDDLEPNLEKITNVVVRNSQFSNLRRFDVRKHSLDATFFIGLDNVGALDSLIAQLQQEFPGVSVSFVDQSHFHGI